MPRFARKTEQYSHTTASTAEPNWAAVANPGFSSTRSTDPIICPRMQNG